MAIKKLKKILQLTFIIKLLIIFIHTNLGKKRALIIQHLCMIFIKNYFTLTITIYE